MVTASPAYKKFFLQFAPRTLLILSGAVERPIKIFGEAAERLFLDVRKRGKTMLRRAPPIQGGLLLGQSFLARFKSWSLDNARHELALR